MRRRREGGVRRGKGGRGDERKGGRRRGKKNEKK